MESIALDKPVYERILELVAVGRFPPGSKLVEEALAKELGVSRVPVRESLTRLVAQGILVGGGKGQSARVREYSLEEVRQLYEYREALEGISARAAASLAAPTDIVHLELICEQAEAAIRGEDRDAWPDLDCQFHMTLAEVGRNQRIIPQVKMLVTECRFVFFIFPYPTANDAQEHLSTFYEEHVRILEAVKARKPEEAEAAARAHMQESIQRFSRHVIHNKLNEQRSL